MIDPERWYEYQRNYQKYGFDMKPKPEPEPAPTKRTRQRKTVKVPFPLASGKKMAFSGVVAIGVIMIMRSSLQRMQPISGMISTL